MRARYALISYSSITTPESHGTHAAVRRDEIWQAFLSLPTDFVKRLYRKTPWDVDQVISVIVTRPNGNDRNVFIRD